jgi:hypothetical protein
MGNNQKASFLNMYEEQAHYNTSTIYKSALD